jgi:hypothetical protein
MRAVGIMKPRKGLVATNPKEPVKPGVWRKNYSKIRA